MGRFGRKTRLIMSEPLWRWEQDILVPRSHQKQGEKQVVVVAWYETYNGLGLSVFAGFSLQFET